MTELCCALRKAFAIALVALDSKTVDVEVTDLIVDWGDERRPIVIAFRFCPFCGAAQSFEEQIAAYSRFREQEDE